MPDDGKRDKLARRLLSKVIHVVDHRHEKIEEELATILHLILHCAAALEGLASPNNEGQVVRSQFGVAVRSIGVGKASRRKDG